MKHKNMLDQYVNDSFGVTDLTFIGNDNTVDDEQNYICEYCNVQLIEKKDDIAHLGYQYNRLICPSCGNIVDVNKEGDTSNVKHAEGIHTLTEESRAEPYIECVGAKSDDMLEEIENPLNDYDSHEADELRNQGQIISSIQTITRSSVDGRIIKEEFEE
jgi:hypothetical protein